MDILKSRGIYQIPECSFSIMTEDKVLCASFTSPEVTEVVGDFDWE